MTIYSCWNCRKTNYMNKTHPNVHESVKLLWSLSTRRKSFPTKLLEIKRNFFSYFNNALFTSNFCLYVCYTNRMASYHVPLLIRNKYPRETTKTQTHTQHRVEENLVWRDGTVNWYGFNADAFDTASQTKTIYKTHCDDNDVDESWQQWVAIYKSIEYHKSLRVWLSARLFVSLGVCLCVCVTRTLAVFGR